MSITRREFVVSSAATAAAVAAALPASRAHAATGSGEPDVIVIGAGLSGLETAITLEENGLKVLLLEGRQRVGGRIYSLFDVPGHPEVGGNTIANAYGRCIAAGAKYGVEIVNLAPKMFANRSGQALYIDGEHVPLQNWPTHPKNPFPAAQKQLPPWGWSNAMFKEHMPFQDLENWYDPKYAQYDVSVHDFLTSKGANDAMIRLGFDTNIAYGTTSHDVSLLQQAFADNWQNVNRGAIMGFSRGGGTAGAGNAANILVGVYRGGNQMLPIAMAKRLKGDLLFGKSVAAISVTDSGASVRCSDGTRYQAKAVVCSMPFSTLRHVALDPLPAPLQHKAIQMLGYIPITQFHLVPKKPFWESDGLPASMWTDGMLGMVLAQQFGETDQVTSLTVWCRGLAAQYIDRFGLQDGARMIIAEFERLRPAAKGLLELGGAHSWAADPFAAGDWAIYQPGQVTEFRHAVAEPHKRLFFCGEHTSVGSRGMEGAFESAERVALEVLGAVA
ncbi:MAG: FAD-dependent oxidoreductase [Steroidobacteraceae bacterium]|nr:FAD-dependent oxidoreductase [Nevskiaceae bacterium]MCP5473096.1 FAD-dependent oxidoreductase [Nevskiaceae bacterium]